MVIYLLIALLNPERF
ncbi:K(+)-transporting ATPase subunit F [Rhodococcus hoagii]|nr:K(+)-transporting ATPase subunit F [Prescottella equi]